MQRNGPSGKLVLAAKVPHMPSLVEGEGGEGGEGDPRAAPFIAALREIGARARALAVDCFVVFDAGWTSHVCYNVDGDAARPRGASPLGGNRELARLIVGEAQAAGVEVTMMSSGAVAPGPGTLVPLRYVDPEARVAVVPVSVPSLGQERDHRAFGEAVLRAIKGSGLRVGILASGPLSRPEAPGAAPAGDPWAIKAPQFSYRLDGCALDLWARGRFDAFAELLPDYARQADKVLAMGDLQMLFGALNAAGLDGPADLLCPYRAYDGAGQTVVDFRV